jgi:hypothetical protein
LGATGKYSNVGSRFRRATSRSSRTSSRMDCGTSGGSLS